ncbi:MAG: hypothetical protein BMS9Abin36_0210 [Gammaproteobacteria bacterium]|nr:MAG: hypothetical protein BMS9Abin36_0210 [Gammaproteobacteria bacterium]
MVPMSCIKHYLDEYDKALLKTLARESIQQGLLGKKLAIDVTRYSSALQVQGASFVTLQHNGQLRGCIGTLEPYQFLVEDVVEHAFAAAFRDPRFPPLTIEEFSVLEISISVLSRPEPITFSDESDLIQQLQSGIDGLILTDQGQRGTFLPSVWESIPDPGSFLKQLKLKAGLPMDYWSDTLSVSRYTTETIA